MAMLEVACPGCGSKLKAPDSMAGKKAKCKKCGTSFRLPGAAADSVGESQMLSAVDVPTAAPAEANPFALDSLLASPPPPPAPPKKPEPTKKPVPQAEPVASDDPFNFAAAAPAPPPPPPAVKKSTPKAAPLPEPKPRAKPKPAPAAAVPFAEPLDEAAPAEALPLDDDVPEAAPAGSADPFAFPGDDSQTPRSRTNHRPPPADDEDHPHRTYHRRPKKSKAPLIATLLGLVALGAVIAVVVVVMSNKKDEPQAKARDEKKEKEPETPPPEKKDDTPKDDTDATKETKGSTRKKGPVKKADPRVAAGGATTVTTPAGGSGGGPLLALGPGVRPIQFRPAAADAPTAKAAGRRPVEVGIRAVKQFFPPASATSDTVFVMQLSAGFQGQGERLGLERYSPVGMKRPDKLEFAGDGQAVPACDVTADTDLFAHAAGGKLTVWKLADRSKLVDDWDLFAEMPEHKKAGIAAVYFVTPESVATVTTAGAVHAWELASKKMLGEYVPVKGAPPGKVAAGKSVARTADRAVVVVAVGGTIYHVGVKGAVGQAEGPVELGGDVGRSLGLAVSGNGKLLYVFETAADAKKEKAVAAIPAGGRGRTTIVKWADAVGSPTSAGWGNEDIAVVGTDKGRAVWFELSEGKFTTLALLTPPGELGLHATGEANHWAVLPDPVIPGQSVLLEYPMPPDGIIELQEQTGGGKPAPTLKLDPKGGA